MSSEGIKILEFNQYQKSDKAPFIMYAKRECLIEKIDGCKNKPENTFTAKVGEHIPSGFSIDAGFHRCRLILTSIRGSGSFQ